jgi:hypothetical protein
MSFSLVSIVRDPPVQVRGATEDSVTTTPGPVSDIRASALVVIGLPILLALLGFASNFLIEQAKLANAMALERFKAELQHSASPPRR